MSDVELGALQSAAETAEGLALGLMAYVAHVCDWELHRRRGVDFTLQGLHAAIEPEDVPVSLTTLGVLLASFQTESRVGELLRAIGEELRAGPLAAH